MVLDLGDGQPFRSIVDSSSHRVRREEPGLLMGNAELRRLGVVVCGAGPATDVAALIEPAVAAGWAVNVIATPAGLSFLDVPLIERLSGAAVRSQPRDPSSDRGRSVGESTTFLVAPATFNTVNKMALGVADTYALAVLAEAIGCGTPVVVVPFVNSALASRAPYKNALESLRREGVRIIEGEDDGWLPHAPGAGAVRQRDFPWRKALEVVDEAVVKGD